MKVVQSWKRNSPDTVTGESITLTVLYSSFDKEEIDELEKNMAQGITITEINKKENEEK